MATRSQFYESLLNNHSVEDILKMPENHASWLVEAFFNILKMRIPLYLCEYQFVKNHRDTIELLANQRNYPLVLQNFATYLRDEYFTKLMPPMIQYLKYKGNPTGIECDCKVCTTQPTDDSRIRDGFDDEENETEEDLEEQEEAGDEDEEQEKEEQ